MLAPSTAAQRFALCEARPTHAQRAPVSRTVCPPDGSTAPEGGDGMARRELGSMGALAAWAVGMRPREGAAPERQFRSV